MSGYKNPAIATQSGPWLPQPCIAWSVPGYPSPGYPSHVLLGVTLATPAMYCLECPWLPQPCIAWSVPGYPSHVLLGVSLATPAMYCLECPWLPQPCIAWSVPGYPSHVLLGVSLATPARCIAWSVPGYPSPVYCLECPWLPQPSVLLGVSLATPARCIAWSVPGYPSPVYCLECPWLPQPSVLLGVSLATPARCIAWSVPGYPSHVLLGVSLATPARCIAWNRSKKTKTYMYRYCTGRKLSRSIISSNSKEREFVRLNISSMDRKNVSKSWANRHFELGHFVALADCIRSGYVGGQFVITRNIFVLLLSKAFYLVQTLLGQKKTKIYSLFIAVINIFQTNISAYTVQALLHVYVCACVHV